MYARLFVPQDRAFPPMDVALLCQGSLQSRQHDFASRWSNYMVWNYQVLHHIIIIIVSGVPRLLGGDLGKAGLLCLVVLHSVSQCLFPWHQNAKNNWSSLTQLLTQSITNSNHNCIGISSTLYTTELRSTRTSNAALPHDVEESPNGARCFRSIFRFRLRFQFRPRLPSFYNTIHRADAKIPVIIQTPYIATSLLPRRWTETALHRHDWQTSSTAINHHHGPPARDQVKRVVNEIFSPCVSCCRTTDLCIFCIFFILCFCLLPSGGFNTDSTHDNLKHPLVSIRYCLVVISRPSCPGLVCWLLFPLFLFSFFFMATVLW